MRISDWSSDVCSSDLACLRFLRTGRTAAQVFRPSSIEPPPRASAPGRTTPRRQRRGTPAGVSTRRGSTLSSRISPLAPQPPAKRDKAAGGDHQPAAPSQRDERLPPDLPLPAPLGAKTGTASGRESVCQYVSITVVSVSLKTK